MQRILEHELIHLAEMLVWEDSNCEGDRFQAIAHRLFGHTEHKHELVTQHERAAKKFNIRVGTMVSFKHEGKTFIGKVNRITRRATVLVADAQGQKYDDGKCYRKVLCAAELAANAEVIWSAVAKLPLWCRR